MKKQILTISVVIALMFLATIPTASSDANESSKVWSDGYVWLTSEMERTDTLVSINLTFTRIEGRYVDQVTSEAVLFDDKGNNYTCDCVKVEGVNLRTEKGELAKELGGVIGYVEVADGSKLLLHCYMPEDRESIRLRFIYSFTESWEKVSRKEGQIEIDLQVTPTPTTTLMPTLSPTPTPIVTPVHLTPTPITLTPTATEIPTPEEKGVQGFEAVFAIAGLLAVVYLLRRRK